MSKELLFRLSKKDFEVEPFKDSGKGGQKRNKTMSCCRIYHRASGAVAEATEQRSFHQNKAVAFKRLLEKPEFKKWHRIQCSKALGTYIDIEQKVGEWLKEDNLKVEGVDPETDKWIQLEENYND